MKVFLTLILGFVVFMNSFEAHAKIGQSEGNASWEELYEKVIDDKLYLKPGRSCCWS